MSNISDRSFFDLFWNRVPRYILFGAASLLAIIPLILEDDEEIIIERVYQLLIVGSIWLFIVTLRELKRSIDQTMDNNHSSKTYKT